MLVLSFILYLNNSDTKYSEIKSKQTIH